MSSNENTMGNIHSPANTFNIQTKLFALMKIFRHFLYLEIDIRANNSRNFCIKYLPRERMKQSFLAYTSSSQIPLFHPTFFSSSLLQRNYISLPNYCTGLEITFLPREIIVSSSEPAITRAIFHDEKSRISRLPLSAHGR